MILFRVNVFREDLISKQLQLIRKSTFSDGKVINVLLVGYQYQNQDFHHYILIYKNSFLKKKYINHRTGKTSFANNIFCNVCFTHFTSHSSLRVHSNICNTKIKQLKVFPPATGYVRFLSAPHPKIQKCSGVFFKSEVF